MASKALKTPKARKAPTCSQCGNPIQVMINKGSGICSERCRKAKEAT